MTDSVVTKKGGLTVLFLQDPRERDLILYDITRAAHLSSGGRCLAVVWDPGATLPAPAAVESIATTHLMGRPTDRVRPLDEQAEEGPAWLLFGTIAVRIMAPGLDQPSGFRSVIIFRSAGPKAYERRQAVSAELQRQSQINVTHKAFTRDVANNTWHFVSENIDDALVRRLAYLLTWADEETVIVSGGNSTMIARPDLNMDTDLVPVPVKRAYYREATLLGEEFS